jgi:UDPglucose 6-dehydrogenase
MGREFRISVIGTGYVGLSTAVGLASMGNYVIAMDIDKEKIQKINSGEIPVYEPGVRDALREVQRKKRLEVTSHVDYAIDRSDFSFICVPTPQKKDGSTDLKYIETASKDIGKALEKKEHYHIVVVKSTVPPETTERVVIPNIEDHSGKKAGLGFGVCMNPEFLREGSALEDFLRPDRVVIGEMDKRSGESLELVYRELKVPILRTGLRVAEMIKYAANAFLAMKISYSNEIGNICKKLGIDAYDVMKGVGMDKRVSPHFLRAGVGYGGSCFPKDLNSVISKSERIGYEPTLLKETNMVNRRQPFRMVDLLKRRLGSFKGKEIAVLGLAFKTDTDDVRDAPSIYIVNELLKNGANIRAYDPKAVYNFRRLFPKIRYTESAKEAIRGSDACLVLTEWEEFRNLTDDDFALMRERIIIEGRKALHPNNVSEFEGLCW